MVFQNSVCDRCQALTKAIKGLNLKINRKNVLLNKLKAIQDVGRQSIQELMKKNLETDTSVKLLLSKVTALTEERNCLKSEIIQMKELANEKERLISNLEFTNSQLNEELQILRKKSKSTNGDAKDNVRSFRGKKSKDEAPKSPMDEGLELSDGLSSIGSPYRDSRFEETYDSGPLASTASIKNPIIQSEGSSNANNVLCNPCSIPICDQNVVNNSLSSAPLVNQDNLNMSFNEMINISDDTNNLTLDKILFDDHTNSSAIERILFSEAVDNEMLNKNELQNVIAPSKPDLQSKSCNSNLKNNKKLTKKTTCIVVPKSSSRKDDKITKSTIGKTVKKKSNVDSLVSSPHRKSSKQLTKKKLETENDNQFEEELIGLDSEQFHDINNYESHDLESILTKRKPVKFQPQSDILEHSNFSPASSEVDKISESLITKDSSNSLPDLSELFFDDNAAAKDTSPSKFDLHKSSKAPPSHKNSNPTSVKSSSSLQSKKTDNMSPVIANCYSNKNPKIEKEVIVKVKDLDCLSDDVNNCRRIAYDSNVKTYVCGEMDESYSLKTTEDPKISSIISAGISTLSSILPDGKARKSSSTQLMSIFDESSSSSLELDASCAHVSELKDSHELYFGISNDEFEEIQANNDTHNDKYLEAGKGLKERNLSYSNYEKSKSDCKDAIGEDLVNFSLHSFDLSVPEIISPIKSPRKKSSGKQILIATDICANDNLLIESVLCQSKVTGIACVETSENTLDSRSVGEIDNSVSKNLISKKFSENVISKNRSLAWKDSLLSLNGSSEVTSGNLPESTFMTSLKSSGSPVKISDGVVSEKLPSYQNQVRKVSSDIRHLEANKDGKLNVTNEACFVDCQVSEEDRKSLCFSDGCDTLQEFAIHESADNFACPQTKMKTNVPVNNHYETKLNQESKRNSGYCLKSKIDSCVNHPETTEEMGGCAHEIITGLRLPGYSTSIADMNCHVSKLINKNESINDIAVDCQESKRITENETISDVRVDCRESKLVNENESIPDVAVNCQESKLITENEAISDVRVDCLESKLINKNESIANVRVDCQKSKVITENERISDVRARCQESKVITENETISDVRVDCLESKLVNENESIPDVAVTYQESKLITENEAISDVRVDCLESKLINKNESIADVRVDCQKLKVITENERISDVRVRCQESKVITENETISDVRVDCQESKPKAENYSESKEVLNMSDTFSDIVISCSRSTPNLVGQSIDTIRNNCVSSTSIRDPEGECLLNYLLRLQCRSVDDDNLLVHLIFQDEWVPKLLSPLHNDLPVAKKFTKIKLVDYSSDSLSDRDECENSAELSSFSVNYNEENINSKGDRVFKLGSSIEKCNSSRSVVGQDKLIDEKKCMSSVADSKFISSHLKKVLTFPLITGVNATLKGEQKYTSGANGKGNIQINCTPSHAVEQGDLYKKSSSETSGMLVTNSNIDDIGFILPVSDIPPQKVSVVPNSVKEDVGQDSNRNCQVLSFNSEKVSNLNIQNSVSIKNECVGAKLNLLKKARIKSRKKNSVSRNVRSNKIKEVKDVILPSSQLSLPVNDNLSCDKNVSSSDIAYKQSCNISLPINDSSERNLEIGSSQHCSVGRKRDSCSPIKTLRKRTHTHLVEGSAEATINKSNSHQILTRSKRLKMKTEPDNIHLEETAAENKSNCLQVVTSLLDNTDENHPAQCSLSLDDHDSLDKICQVKDMILSPKEYHSDEQRPAPLELGKCGPSVPSVMEINTNCGHTSNSELISLSDNYLLCDFGIGSDAITEYKCPNGIILDERIPQTVLESSDNGIKAESDVVSLTCSAIDNKKISPSNVDLCYSVPVKHKLPIQLVEMHSVRAKEDLASEGYKNERSTCTALIEHCTTKDAEEEIKVEVSPEKVTKPSFGFYVDKDSLSKVKDVVLKRVDEVSKRVINMHSGRQSATPNLPWMSGGGVGKKLLNVLTIAEDQLKMLLAPMNIVPSTTASENSILKKIFYEKTCEYNRKCKKKPPKRKYSSKGIKEFEDIALDLFNKINSDDSNGGGFNDNVLHEEIYLSTNCLAEKMINLNPKDVADCLVDAIFEDDGILDMKFTPPAPPLTKFQQACFYAVCRASSKDQSFIVCLLHSLETPFLNHKNIFEITKLSRLVHFHTALCRYLGDVKRSRRLLYRILYTLEQKVYYLVKFMLPYYPVILPTFSAETDVLSTTMMFILSVISNSYKVINAVKEEHMWMRRYIHKNYCFENSRIDHRDTMKDIIMSHFHQPGARHALILLCKRHCWKWVRGVIEKNLYPIIFNWLNDTGDEVITCSAILCLGVILQNASFDDQPTEDVNNGLVVLQKVLHKQISIPVLEAAVNSICTAGSRHSIHFALDVLSAWTPFCGISESMEKSICQLFKMYKPKNVWIPYLKKNVPQ